jgi:hypothetical protein
MKTIHFVSEPKLDIKVSLISTTNIKDGKISITACISSPLIEEEKLSMRWVPLLDDPVHGGSSRHA